VNIGVHLHHRDNASVDVETEAGHGQGLHISYHLLGRLAGGRQDMELAHPIGFPHHPHRIDIGEAAESFFDFAVVHFGQASAPSKQVSLERTTLLAVDS
jgi:hypothetical protein